MGGLHAVALGAHDFSDVLIGEVALIFIHPKMDQAIVDPAFLPLEYHQVFSDRLGFQPNLSILDLIFNLGPDSLSYLQACLKI